jgi:hypothetical protein
MGAVAEYGPIQFAIMAEWKNRAVLLSCAQSNVLPDKGEIAFSANFAKIRANLGLETVARALSDLAPMGPPYDEFPTKIPTTNCGSA